MKVRTCWIMAVLSGVLAGAACAAEWYAAPTNNGTTDGQGWPTAFTNLQTALDTATNNDTLYIKGGTYTVTNQLIWNNSGVTILGAYEGTNASGAGNYSTATWPTVITGTRGQGSTNRVLWINTVKDGRLERVTVCNGYLNYWYPAGGPNPYLSTNDNRGANLFVSGCTNLILTDITSSNGYTYTYSRSSYGVGAYVLNSTNVLMGGCLVQRNSMGCSGNDWLFGGGLYSKDSWLTVSNCVIKGNYRDAAGILGQSDSGRGAGVYLDGGAVTLWDSIITANDNYSRSSAEGGGVYVAGGTHWFRNCLIAANDLYVLAPGYSGTLQGDGIYVNGGSTVLENCSIAYNFGQGVARGAGTIACTNCIIWGNGDDVAGSVNLASCIIEDGDSNGVNGCFASDPRFERGFYLEANSPCVDHGVTTAGSGALAGYTTRADGTLDGSTVDIGYHHTSGIDPAVADLYASPLGSDTGGNAGTNWTTAFRSITKCLSLAREGTRIHIASGPYTNGCETFPLSMNQFGLQLLGTNNADTVINASGSGQGAISAEGVAGDAKIQGVKITGGVGMNPSARQPFYEAIAYNTRYGSGGGILLAISAVEISSCIISNNPLAGYEGQGGGIYLESSMSTVSNCIITANSSAVTLYADGVGIYARGNSILTVVDSTISSNSGVSSARRAFGGAVYMGHDTNNYSVFQRCVIVGNRLQAHTDDPANGAGLSIKGVSTMENCLIAYNKFSGTTAATNGGGICLVDGSLTLQNVTVATNDVEGVQVTAGTLAANNCIFWGNRDDLANVTGTVAYSYVQNGDFNTTNGCVTGDPGFVDTTYFHLRSPFGNYVDGYFSGGGWGTSRPVSPLIDAGDRASSYAHEPEPNGRRINLGAYGNTAVASLTVAIPGIVIELN